MNHSSLAAWNNNSAKQDPFPFFLFQIIDRIDAFFKQFSRVLNIFKLYSYSFDVLDILPRKESKWNGITYKVSSV